MRGSSAVQVTFRAIKPAAPQRRPDADKMNIRPLGVHRHSQRESVTCADIQDVGRLREPDSAHPAEARGGYFDPTFTAAHNFDRAFTESTNRFGDLDRV